MKKVHTNPYRIAAAERMQSVHRERYEVFCQLRSKYATWSQFAKVTNTSMSLLQGVHAGRHRLSEGLCKGVEAGLQSPNLFGLAAISDQQVSCMPDHYRARLLCVQPINRLDYFRYLRVHAFLEAYPKSATLNQENHVGKLLGFPGAAPIYSITRYGQRVTEEVAMVFEAVPGFDGWFDPAEMSNKHSLRIELAAGKF